MVKAQLHVLAVLAVLVLSLQSASAKYAFQGYYPQSGSYSGLQTASYGLMLVIILATLFALTRWTSFLTRLVLVGTALILLGTIAWLYGDYAGGLPDYIWDGVACIFLGTAVWIFGDMRGGAFKKGHPNLLVEIGILLIVVGTAAWVYGELYAPGASLYWWVGTALLIIGTAVWLYGDAKAGAFLRKKK